MANDWVGWPSPTAKKNRRMCGTCRTQAGQPVHQFPTLLLRSQTAAKSLPWSPREVRRTQGPPCGEGMSDACTTRSIPFVRTEEIRHMPKSLRSTNFKKIYRRKKLVIIPWLSRIEAFTNSYLLENSRNLRVFSADKKASSWDAVAGWQAAWQENRNSRSVLRARAVREVRFLYSVS